MSELNIPVPFSLISNDVANDRLIIMPAYWFMYNMYALARNAWKSEDRDQRQHKVQHLEFDYLAPDTINEMLDAIHLFNSLTPNENGEAEIKGWENSKRKIIITKIPQATKTFSEMIRLHACLQILNHINIHKSESFDTLTKQLKFKSARSKWLNIGGQMILVDELEKLKKNIKTDKIKSWDDVHRFYETQGRNYEQDKTTHALSSLMELLQLRTKDFTPAFFKSLLKDSIAIKKWMTENIETSRAKDYSSSFRKMMYENDEEMNQVIGKLDDNSFINEQKTAFAIWEKKINTLIKKWKI
jgi:hypothetical protein